MESLSASEKVDVYLAWSEKHYVLRTLLAKSGIEFRQILFLFKTIKGSNRWKAQGIGQSEGVIFYQDKLIANLVETEVVWLEYRTTTSVLTWSCTFRLWIISLIKKILLTGKFLNRWATTDDSILQALMEMSISITVHFTRHRACHFFIKDSDFVFLPETFRHKQGDNCTKTQRRHWESKKNENILECVMIKEQNLKRQHIEGRM